MAKSKSHHSPKKGSVKPRKSADTGMIGLPESSVPAIVSPTEPASYIDVKVAEAVATSKIDTGVPDEKPAEQQWWFRKPDSKARKLAEKIAVMREAGRSDKEIAKKLGTTEQTVRQTAYLARKNGWWDAQDEPVDVEAELAFDIDRKIVRNVSAILDGQMTNYQTFELTKEGAKGRGMFKSHEKTEGVTQLAAVAIQIVMPPIGAGDQTRVISDQDVGGVPAYLEGDVSDGATTDTAGSLVPVGAGH